MEAAAPSTGQMAAIDCERAVWRVACRQRMSNLWHADQTAKKRKSLFGPAQP
jgi:hypothetical protein